MDSKTSFFLVLIMVFLVLFHSFGYAQTISKTDDTQPSSKLNFELVLNFDTIVGSGLPFGGYFENYLIVKNGGGE